MIDKYEEIKSELDSIDAELSRPEILSDQKKMTDLSRRRIQLLNIFELFEKRNLAEKNLTEAEAVISANEDEELVAMAEEEATEKKIEIEKLNAEIEIALLPQDENDTKNIIVEIRAGAGGDESSLFAGELFRMYSRFAESKGWKTEIMDSHPSDVGGYKEIIFEIKGTDVYKYLKYESGVHRVQRVPETESGGRIHTSTVTVAVLPEAEEIELAIDPKEIRIDVFRSSGPGGQSVNTTDSAVRITHLPTGLVVSVQDEKSQIKNREKAMSILRSRLLAAKQEEEARKRGDARKSQIGTGDRSEKIRTYNFPQDRVTDHRINFSLHNLPGFMSGNIGEMVDKLLEVDRTEAIKALE
jgi:peptide chain release factor 1